MPPNPEDSRGCHPDHAPSADATQDQGSDRRESASKLTSSGSPQARNAAALADAESETREQLYLRAAALGINGRSRMTKDTLRDAVARREAEEAGAPRPTTR